MFNCTHGRHEPEDMDRAFKSLGIKLLKSGYRGVPMNQDEYNLIFGKTKKYVDIVNEKGEMRYTPKITSDESWKSWHTGRCIYLDGMRDDDTAKNISDRYLCDQTLGRESVDSEFKPRTEYRLKFHAGYREYPDGLDDNSTAALVVDLENTAVVKIFYCGVLEKHDYRHSFRRKVFFKESKEPGKSSPYDEIASLSFCHMMNFITDNVFDCLILHGLEEDGFLSFSKESRVWVFDQKKWDTREEN